MKFRALLVALGIVLASGGLLAVNAQAGKDLQAVADISRTNGASASVDAGLAVGWNVVLAQNCQMYWYNNALYYQVYASNGSAFWTTNWQFQGMMEPSCQNGHWMAFYVYESTGAWSSVYTWTY